MFVCHTTSRSPAPAAQHIAAPIIATADGECVRVVWHFRRHSLHHALLADMAVPPPIELYWQTWRYLPPSCLTGRHGGTSPHHAFLADTAVPPPIMPYWQTWRYLPPSCLSGRHGGTSPHHAFLADMAVPPPSCLTGRHDGTSPHPAFPADMAVPPPILPYWQTSLYPWCAGDTFHALRTGAGAHAREWT